MDFEVLFEDNHLIIVNKKPGDLVQSDITGDRTLADKVSDYVAKKYNKTGKAFIGIPHRLDRPTSGIVVLARTSKALERMNKIFRERLVDKTYWAIVDHKPPKQQDRIVNFLKKNEKQNKSYVFPEGSKGALESILSYRLVKSLNNYHLLEVILETGRHHQIRTQLSNLGCHIKGDVKYGARRANKDLSIHLHSRSIKFIHPVKKESIYIEARPPNDSIWNSCL